MRVDLSPNPSQTRDIFIYYLFSFFTGVYLANGTTVLFERVLGFSYQQIFVLGGIYMLMFVLFEIPTGALADLVGRKKTLFLGSLILAAAALATGLSSTFLQVFLSFFIWALGFSCVSGANEALLYDRVQNEKLYARVLGKSQVYFLVGSALSGILGPYLFSLHFRFAYLFSSIPFAVGALVLLFFHESHRTKTFSLFDHWRQMKEGAKIAFHNRFVLWAIGIMSLSFGVWYTLNNSYQPYLQNSGWSLRAFSVILPVLFIVQAIGGGVGGKLYLFRRESRIFLSSVVLIAGMLAFLGFFPVRAGVVFLFGYIFLEGFIRPAISTYSNRHVAAPHRATVISVQSMVATVTAALMLFLFGGLTDRIGLNALFIILGALVFVLGIMLMIFRPKEQT